MSDSLLICIPLIVLVAVAVATMAAEVFVGPRSAIGIAVLGLVASALVSGLVVEAVPGGSVAFGVLRGGGGISAAVTAVVALSALAALGGSAALSREQGGAAVASLMVFATAGSAALVQSTDLLMSVIALETIAVCAYAMVGSSPGPRAAESGMKYAIQGAVSSGMLLLGAAILLGLYGPDPRFDALVAGMIGMPLLPVATGAALVGAGFAFKMGAVPFHSWAPDAFETTRPSASAFMASAPKVAAVVGFVALVANVFEGPVERIAGQIAVIATLSIVVGNLGGLRQKSFGRMLGYSGIAQIGYAVAGIVVGVGLEPGGFAAMLPYILVLVVAYALGAAGSFIAAQAVRDHRPDWDGSIVGMRGLFRERPMLAFAIAACMLSMTGIPLTAGFWGKLFVFGLAATEGWLWLAVVGVVGSVVSFGYYGSVLRSIFFEKPLAEDGELSSSDAADLEGEQPADIRPSRMAEYTAFAVGLIIVAVGIVPMFIGVFTLPLLFAG